MVGRYKEEMRQDAVIVDLDGTLVNNNTFQVYIKYCLCDYLRSGRIISAMRLLLYLTARFCRLISHARMKYHILMLTVDLFKDKPVDELVDQIMTNANKEVVDDLRQLQIKGYPVYLATAAPLIYSSAIADRIKASGVIATENPRVETDWYETRGEKKLMEVDRLLEQSGFNLWRVYTDHHDDIPLISHATETILINPTDKTVELVAAAGVNFDVMRRKE